MSGRRTEVSSEVKQMIVKLKNDGLSLRKIAEITGRTHSTIQYVLKRYEERDSVENKHRTGRPSKLTARDKRQVLKMVKQNPLVSAPQIAATISRAKGEMVHAQVIRRTLWDSGYHGRTPRRKPCITETNRLKRLQFAQRYKDQTEAFWERVLFSDESKFALFEPDRQCKVWRRAREALKPQNVLSTVKHGGGSVLVWGCMGANGVGELVFIEGTMDRWGYLNILRNNLHQSVEKLQMEPNWLFQQDNDPKHTARIVQEWLLYNVPQQLHTPPQSPDLNPIEHLWGYLKKQIRNHRISGKRALRTALIEEWNKIPSSVTRNLVQSMHRRLHAVITANGGPTKY